MKTTKKHFKIFKKEAKKWIDKLELNDWKVYFQHLSEYDDLNENYFGSCRMSLSGMCATITFCGDWCDDVAELNTTNIKDVAKHEVIHLLLGKFSIRSADRFISEKELNTEEESLVVKLTKLF